MTIEKVEIVSKKCVNSNWVARFLAKEDEEYCQCSIGECKVKVSVAMNGHNPYTFILTRKELEDITNKIKITAEKIEELEPNADTVELAIDMRHKINELIRAFNKITK